MLASFSTSRLHQSILMLGFALVSGVTGYAVDAPVLNYQAFAHHVEKFNTMEPETVVNHVPDAQAWDWMQQNVPRFECPDAQITDCP